MDKRSPRHEGMKRFLDHKFFHAISRIGSNLHFGKVEKHFEKEEELRQNKP